MKINGMVTQKRTQAWRGTSGFSILIIFGLMIASFTARGQSDDNAFGDSIPISIGLLGKIYLLPDTTRSLPDFDTLTPLPNVIYARRVDVSERNWSAGFPGLRSRFEYFGIEYLTHFQVMKSGNYYFHLLSDDGSKLWIDDSLIINYDGIHAADTKSSNIILAAGMHSFKLDYFQGPRFKLALLLTYSLDTAKEQIFPGNMFILRTPTPFNYWLWLIALLVVSAAIFMYYRRKKNKD